MNTQLTFPCDFTLKIIGHRTPSFEGEVLKILNKHIPQLFEGAFKLKNSTQGKYLSMSVNFKADSQQQLDDLYRELSSNPEVLFAL